MPLATMPTGRVGRLQLRGSRPTARSRTGCRSGWRRRSAWATDPPRVYWHARGELVVEDVTRAALAVGRVLAVGLGLRVAALQQEQAGVSGVARRWHLVLS